MLETKNLGKVYKTKGGRVTALKDITLRFPDTGMVFLLGKSGCGKSTLLSILGGLDRCTSGEVIWGGKSSRDLNRRHFDAYRNTCVGFVFQEYDLLEEFSVGANVALALRLQGQKADPQRIGGVLRQVGLTDCGSRRPGELSGGQKQRVAIARALVKDPKIIMADEPVGALDAETGREIMQTLKNLSKDKLVIVVSHNRDYAECYGDRIIELEDGQVLRDVERQEAVVELAYEEETISIPQDYQLTEAEGKAVADYVQGLLNQGREPRIRASHGIFTPTRQEKAPEKTEELRLIRSRLPLHHAFILGASGLKHKKFRLAMTILLCVLALTLFGVADTFGSYDAVQTSTRSLADPRSRVDYATFQRYQQEKNPIPLGAKYIYSQTAMTQEDLELIEAQTGLKTCPVYTYGDGEVAFLSFRDHVDMGFGESYVNGRRLLRSDFSGFIEVDRDLFKDMGVEVTAGHLPLPGTNELALSTYLLHTFQEFGYRTCRDGVVQTIKTAEDLLGKTLTVEGIEYTISGVVDTGVAFSRSGKASQMVDALEHSLTGYAIVAKGHIQTLMDKDLGVAISASIAPMPKDLISIRRISVFANGSIMLASGKTVQFRLENPVSNQLRNLDWFFRLTGSILIWVGALFLIIASVRFGKYIALSVAHKRRQIGILRAVGARRWDVFLIFFVEALLIALINFGLSLALTVCIAAAVNSLLLDSGLLLLKVMNVGFRQAALLLGTCLLVALAASFFPVRRIASKRPVDILRGR